MPFDRSKFRINEEIGKAAISVPFVINEFLTKRFMNKLFTLLVLSLFIFGCSDSNDDNGKEVITDNQTIIGKWKADESYADITGMEFTKYGDYYYGIKGEAGTKTGTYRYEKGKLYVQIKDTDGSAINDVVNCGVEGDKLLYDSQYYYTRQ